MTGLLRLLPTIGMVGPPPMPYHNEETRQLLFCDGRSLDHGG